MKITIQDLALVKKAEVEIGGLTVLCGKNNSGKTYVTHTIFGVLDHFRKNVLPGVQERIISRVEREGAVKLSDADLRKVMQEGIDVQCKQSGRSLQDILATETNRIQGAKISLKLISPIRTKGRVRYSDAFPAYGLRYELDGNIGGEYLIKAAIPTQFRSSQDKQEYEIAKRFIRDDFAAYVQSIYLPKVFICSTERTGAAIFQRELDFTRSRLIDLIKRNRNHGSLAFDLIGQFVAEYPLAVRNDVDFVREFPSRCEKKGEWARQHERLLADFADIVGGSYASSESGLRFVPKASGKNEIKLRMTESSSSVRALMDLAGYLKCYARSGDLLMIDEPEMNLHPENQRRLARFFAELVNSGINVFITTHSDYIIKEFNLLLLMNSASAKKRGIAARNGYEDSSLLESDRVHFYLTEVDHSDKARRVVEPILVTQDGGIDKSSFDGTIDSMNRLFDELYWED